MNATRISLQRAVTLGQPLLWPEVAAIACETLVQLRRRPAGAADGLTLDTCTVTRGGDVVLTGAAAVCGPKALDAFVAELLTLSDDPERLRASLEAGDVVAHLDDLAARTPFKRRRVAIATAALRGLAAEADWEWGSGDASPPSGDGASLWSRKAGAPPRRAAQAAAPPPPRKAAPPEERNSSAAPWPPAAPMASALTNAAPPRPSAPVAPPTIPPPPTAARPLPPRPGPEPDPAPTSRHGSDTPTSAAGVPPDATGAPDFDLLRGNFSTPASPDGRGWRLFLGILLVALSLGGAAWWSLGRPLPSAVRPAPSTTPAPSSPPTAPAR